MDIELNDTITFEELYKIIGRLTAEKYGMERELNKLMKAYQELSNAGSKLGNTDDGGSKDSSPGIPEQ